MQSRHHQPRLFYGWVVVAIAFITMAVAISARTSFSLLYPAILDEFGWSRGLTAGAYSVGFVLSTAILPFTGAFMERFGPRIIVPIGALFTAIGFLILMIISDPVGLYIALGLFIMIGSMASSYVVHSMFIPNWFVRNRGLAVGIAFSGVGVGALVLLPLCQYIIATYGWRMACLSIALAVIAVLVPLNALFQRTRPETMGLLPDGDDRTTTKTAKRPARHERILDPDWAATDWTVARAARTLRFWALFIAMMSALFVWYGIQTHQTKFLIDKGFDAGFAATALGLTAFFGIFGQIGIGALSDRIGRELAWTIAHAGFGAASILFVLIDRSPSIELVYLALAAQGFLGYGMSAIFGAITMEVFSGRRVASILALMGLGGNLGGGAGPWALGFIYDTNGSYEVGFWLCWGMSILSILSIWVVAPSRIRTSTRPARRPNNRRPQARRPDTLRRT